MKTFVFILLTSVTLNINAQQMEEKDQIQEVVTRLFVETDKGNWNQVEEVFHSEVKLDYSSMNGNPAAVLSPTEITGAWKTVLPGFAHTHHQIGNFITKVDEETAHTFCYGTATHYLEDEKGNLWTVVGSYDFDLKKVNGKWKITAMTFNYKYQDGNSELISKAIDHGKEK